MKKIILASIVILSAFFTSCAKSNLVVEPDGANTLRAVMENSDGGRTTLDDGRNVIWSAGDKLSVFNQADQKQQAEYTLIKGAGTTSADFQSDKPLGAGVKYAFYPASAEVTCAADVISFNLPTTQAYAKASFANGSNPMVAKSNALGNLSFKNLCGVIKFQLTGTATVAKVEMKTAGEVVAGAMTVKMGYTGAPAMEVAKTGTTSTSITLTDCNVSLSESVNSTFYFTVPAGTYAPGLTFTAYNSAGKVIISKSTKSSLTVSRSRIASLPGTSENLYFPDANFRKKLVDKYNFVQTADGTDIDITNPVNAGKLKTTTLDVSNITVDNITNAVSGAASKAAAAMPLISSLKGIEYFTELTYLDCDANSLTALDVSANKMLTVLKCGYNSLPTLDVSKNTALTTLWCFGNPLTTLDVSKNTALTTLWCFENQLTTLDVSKNTALTSLWCSGNQLTTLDVSANTALTSLDCSHNQLKTLDVSANTALTSLDCSDIQLPTLDVSKNTQLTELDCYANQLTTLDVSKNTALTSLWCWDNKLTTLDVSKNTALTTLNCDNNQLPTLDVSKNTALTTLWCYGNQLPTLDVSKNTALTTLWCYGNQLTTLDVSGCTTLATLDCHDNQLNTLTVSGCTALTKLWCDYNQLTTLDVSKNTQLTELGCRGTQLKALDVSKNTALTNLSCYDNQLTTLDVSGCTALTSLSCASNQLTTLDVSKNTALTLLWCSGNQLTTLDVSKNTALTLLYCDGNRMSALDITMLSALVNPDNLKCGKQKKADGTTAQTLTLTLTQAQKDIGGLGEGTYNTGVTLTVKTPAP